MTQKWYYVEGSQRIGPISIQKLEELIKDETISETSYVWVKGMENWVKANTVEEFSAYFKPEVKAESSKEERINWDNIPEDAKLFVIKIGLDRGMKEEEYGPYDLTTLKKAADEGRINQKTFIFAKGMEDWAFIGDLPMHNLIFPGQESDIQESERRTGTRKPFIAKMIFHNHKNVFEGVCRDISMSGLQVLISDFPGEIGDEISLNVHPSNDGHSFVASGKVVRILDGGQGFSLQFVDLNQEAESAINNYISG